jgi:hypothetical protein
VTAALRCQATSGRRGTGRPARHYACQSDCADLEARLRSRVRMLEYALCRGIDRVRSPHQIHISRIYFIGRRIGSLPERRLRTGLPPKPLLRMEAVHVQD